MLGNADVVPELPRQSQLVGRRGRHSLPDQLRTHQGAQAVALQSIQAAEVDYTYLHGDLFSQIADTSNLQWEIFPQMSVKFFALNWVDPEHPVFHPGLCKRNANVLYLRAENSSNLLFKQPETGYSSKAFEIRVSPATRAFSCLDIDAGHIMRRDLRPRQSMLNKFRAG